MSRHIIRRWRPQKNWLQAFLLFGWQSPSSQITNHQWIVTWTNVNHQERFYRIPSSIEGHIERWLETQELPTKISPLINYFDDFLGLSFIVKKHLKISNLYFCTSRSSWVSKSTPWVSLICRVEDHVFLNCWNSFDAISQWTCKQFLVSCHYLWC